MAGGRTLKRAISRAAVAMSLGLALAPAAALAKPGTLDRSFGHRGKVVTVLPSPERVRSYPDYRLPFEFAPGRVAMANAPGNKLVVASSQAIVEYRADGSRERGFGGNGAVQIEPINGVNFQLADVAVDSRGRILIAGTTKDTDGVGMGGQAVAGPIPSIGTIRRYLSSGVPDPSFGADGVVHAYFGAPPATFQGNPYPEPAVSLIGLAVDRENRPIVTGSSVAEVVRCGEPAERFERSGAFIARLAGDGGPDPSFNGGATLGITQLSWLSLPTPGPNGLHAVGGSFDPCDPGLSSEPSILVGIGDNGLTPSFGGDGFLSHPFTRVSDLAAAPGGKIVLLARTIELSHGRWVESAGTAVRLRNDGSVDPRFGHRGEARVKLPKRSSIAAIATDRKGHVLLAGTLRRKPPRRNNSHLMFLLIRTTAQGLVDRRFGHRGRVVTAFGRRPSVRATGLLVDRRNRIVIGGKYANRASANAFALARYIGGR